MALLKNTSRYGAVEVPDLRRVVEAGDVVDVPDQKIAAALITSGHFSPARQKRTAPTEGEDA